MSDNDALRRQSLIEEASGIVAAANGKIKIVQAMKLVGFSTPERKNMTVYQQVRRRSLKVSVVEVRKGNNGRSLPGAFSMPSVSSTVSGMTSSRSTTSTLCNSSSSQEDTPPDDASANTTRSVRRKLLEHESATVAAGTVATSKAKDKMPIKKGRRSSKEVQRANAMVVMQTKRDKDAMKMATQLIQHCKTLPKGHPEKKSINVIVAEVNERMQGTISAKTASRYVLQGLVETRAALRKSIQDFDYGEGGRGS